MDSVDLLKYLEKEIALKVAVGSMDLLRHLEKEIPFKVPVDSEDLLEGNLLLKRPQ